MCGIAGYIKFNASIENQGNRVVSSMLNALMHRGPDDWGMISNAKNNDEDSANFYFLDQHQLPEFTIGHRRLSILDLSVSGRQPMLDNEHKLAISYNGEIYNYIEIRNELSLKYEFKTQTDTEVLLKAYVEWGTDMLTKLDGMFSFAILDMRKNIIFAARDPMGIKPFYYNFSENSSFTFASEPAAVLKGLGINGTLNKKQSSDFLILGVMDHNEGTFFNEVVQLKGGHFLTLDLSTSNLAINKYWTPPPLADFKGKDPVELFKEIATTTIARQLRSDVPLGSSLSGGIDSSTIVTIAGKILGPEAANYKALTFSFPGFKNDEATSAKSVADHTGMQWHSVIPEVGSLAADLKKMTINMGEPYSTLSMFAQYKVMQAAKELGITVMLDGQGGDEIYLGYPRMVQNAMLYYLKKGKLGKFFREWKGMSDNLSIPMYRSILSSFYFNSANLAISRRKARLKEFISPELMEAYDKNVAKDVYAPKNVYQKQEDELLKYTLPRLLRFADRNSMAFGIEQRVPHLGQPIIEFALSLPLEWRVNNGWSKYIVRRSMSGSVPDHILWDKIKRGFDIPQTYWVDLIATDLSNWIQALPDDAPLHKANIIKALKGPERGSHYLWNVVSLALFIHFSKVQI